MVDHEKSQFSFLAVFVDPYSDHHITKRKQH